MKDDKRKKIFELSEPFLHFLIIFTVMVGIPFMISGVWPPFVSVLSESMEPNLNTGDFVFTVDNERYTDNDLPGGVYTMEDQDRSSFNEYGDVIIFYPNGDTTKTPILHRAAFYVEEGENWINRPNKSITLRSCDETLNCPAPHDGFITKGDNNPSYDQAGGLSRPVKEEWIESRAKYRIPFVGHIRNVSENIFSIKLLPNYLIS